MWLAVNGARVRLYRLSDMDKLVPWSERVRTEAGNRGEVDFVPVEQLHLD